MMEKLFKLKVKKLFKELEYYQSEVEYRDEIVPDIEIEFNKNVETMLNKNPELGDIYRKMEEEIRNRAIDNVKMEIEEMEMEESEDYEEIYEEKSEEDTPEAELNHKIKKLYRLIVKKTHPDKVKEEYLKKLYMLATDCYNDNDLFGIYVICGKLEIEYEIEENELDLLFSKIDSYRSRIKEIEDTFHWRWYESNKEEDKELIVLGYIKQKLMI